MAKPVRHRGSAHPRALTVLGALAVIVVAALSSSSSAKVPAAKNAAVDGTIPPVNDSTYALGYGNVGIAPAALAAKAKIIIKVPGTVSVVDFLPSYETDPDPELGAYSRYATVGRWPRCATKADPAVDSFVVADLYAVSTTNGGHPYGVYPATPVSMLAFGSIPVTAVLHLSQPVVRGAVQPLRAYGGTASTSPACDPNWTIDSTTGEVPYAFSYAVGQLNLSITDVKVDGEPVPVGSNCRTVTPLQVNMWGADGYYPVSGGLLIQRQDDSIFSVANNGPDVDPKTHQHVYLNHPGSTNLTIPAFTGCSGGGDDVSRLITSMVSGTGNQLQVNQGQVTLGTVDPDDPAGCVDADAGAAGCPTIPAYPTITPPR